MSKIYSALILLFLAVSAHATNYPGNGNGGFGGPVGQGSLDINTDGTDITFTLTRGPGNMNDAIVIYIDDQPGGFATTKKFTDFTYELPRAISGFDGGTNRATFNFNTGFKPDYALAFQPAIGGFVGGSLLVLLANNANFTYISSPPVTNVSDPSALDFSVTIAAVDIGLNHSVKFDFMATCISNTGYRSDEAIGDPMTGFTQGWNEYTSTTAPLTYDPLVPVTFGSFTGAYKNNSVQLSWSTKTEINAKQFVIQKSNNGSSWNNIASVYAKNTSSGAQYSYTDNQVTDAKSYYRIQLVNLDGSYQYTSAIIVRKDITRTIDLLGNPVKGTVKLSITNEMAASYTFELFTGDGRKVASQTYQHGGGTSQFNLNIPLAVKGVCMLRITSGTEVSTLKLIAQ